MVEEHVETRRPDHSQLPTDLKRRAAFGRYRVDAPDRSGYDRLRVSALLSVASIVVGGSELLGKQEDQGGNESNALQDVLG